MMENSDSDTFDTLVFDALVSKEANTNSRAKFIPAEGSAVALNYEVNQAICFEREL